MSAFYSTICLHTRWRHDKAFACVLKAGHEGHHRHSFLMGWVIR